MIKFSIRNLKNTKDLCDFKELMDFWKRKAWSLTMNSFNCFKPKSWKVWAEERWRRSLFRQVENRHSQNATMGMWLQESQWNADEIVSAPKFKQPEYWAGEILYCILFDCPADVLGMLPREECALCAFLSSINPLDTPHTNMQMI